MGEIMPGVAERDLIYSVSIILFWLRQFPAEETGWRGSRNAVDFQVHHEIITPHWRADESSGHDKHPPRAEVEITVEGRNLILNVEKNEFRVTE